MTQGNLSGPVGTSCLTCKRRHKKCDQGRPTCQRCIEGCFECLGYSHIRQRKLNGPEVGASNYGSLEGVFQASTHTNLDNSNLGTCDQTQLPTDTLPYGHPESKGYHSVASTDGLQDLLVPSGTSSNLSLLVATVNNYRNAHLSSASGTTTDSSDESSENYPSRSHVASQNDLRLLPGARAARALSTLSPSMRQMIHYVFDQYERVLDSVFFKPKPPRVEKMRALVATRVQASSITRCSIILVAKIIESQLNGTAPNNRVAFQQLVQRFETRLREAKAKDLNPLEYPLEFEYLLNGLLELAFLKMRVSTGFHVYRLLHDANPTFFEIVNFDSSLWPDPNGPPVPCIAKMVTSTRFELAHFALIDILSSMAYGLPQVVNYETATLVPETEIHPIAWVHCCPLEFQVCIAEMNQRCAKSYVAPDWHVIEHRLLSYQGPMVLTDGADSWRTIARLAVLESWRQVLLIYLYMAVCGVSSDDGRVQSAVRQTFQLFKFGEQERSPNVHFMFQYLIAGVCTNDEKQRAFVRERLSNAFNHERWLLPGCEFVPVLDHLWHGAAANGQPFRWSDYIRSRQVALPIPV
ncbi:unnamed protein product [Rhizoctonia solani]|uniref:Zn(2)-C6 fungal-type domain-containing protein n=1 Tax=Rhizoctonia solani TaxID=456999 RepID=A0A8H3ECI7_9AGAM|nr:unnamed protein product [Rhizoctonia solani]